MKNACDERICRLNTVEERLSELDYFDKIQRKIFIKLGCVT